MSTAASAKGFNQGELPAYLRVVGWGQRHPILPIIVVFAFFPLVFPYVGTATQILIFGLFAMGYNILLGYTGLLSFGHAAYFGLGAYGAGILLVNAETSVFLALLSGCVTAVLGAAFVGFFALRRRGIYFALLTLAFAQASYFIFGFVIDGITGGDNGLTGVPRPEPSFFGLFKIPIENPYYFYYFCLFFTALALVMIKRILDSPFGAVLQAIRENDSRATACGYNTDRVKYMSFIISGFFCGLAGALQALFIHFVDLEYLYWVTSGNVVMMTLLGGMGTFFGPFIGATVLFMLEEFISNITESWMLFVGGIVIFCVVVMPAGLWGTLMKSALFTRRALAEEGGALAVQKVKSALDLFK